MSGPNCGPYLVMAHSYQQGDARHRRETTESAQIARIGHGFACIPARRPSTMGV
jgi:hypothetical protein